MTNPTRPAQSPDVPRLIEWIEGLSGPVDAVTAAGYANDYSPWATDSVEWSLFIKALGSGLDAPGAALSLVERVKGTVAAAEALRDALAMLSKNWNGEPFVSALARAILAALLAALSAGEPT